MKKTIDAKNQKLGRVASRAAVILMGKDDVNFAKNKVADVQVEITNASAMDITETKRKNKIYQTYSGYPGGQKELSMEKVIDKNGYEKIIKIAIKGMLPANKLRSKMLRNLIIKD